MQPQTSQEELDMNFPIEVLKQKSLRYTTHVITYSSQLPHKMNKVSLILKI